jgi:hypothetical protein
MGVKNFLLASDQKKAFLSSQMDYSPGFKSAVTNKTDRYIGWPVVK